VALGGNGQPLPGNVVLTAAEANTIRNYVNTYNASIVSAANTVGAAVVDANSVLSQIAQTGVNIGGVTFNSAFLTGGLFSYDGVHPTNFGYAYIANLFIEAINEKFGGNIPEVDLSAFMFGQKSLNMTPAPFYFSPLAWDNLRASLNVPTQQQIDQGGGHKPRRGHHH